VLYCNETWKITQDFTISVICFFYSLISCIFNKLHYIIAASESSLKGGCRAVDAVNNVWGENARGSIKQGGPNAGEITR
jgi:hypothetical protein